MPKYNTQKHSKGRRLNRENQKPKEEKNQPYMFYQIDNSVYYIDSLFEEDVRENRTLKTIYLQDENEFIPVAYIDETVQMDCEFMEKMSFIHNEIHKKIVFEDNPDIMNNYKFIYTRVNPSTIDSSSYTYEEFEKGYYFLNGKFELFSRFNEDNHWAISGHSRCLYENVDESLDLEKIKNMNCIEFFKYFKTLQYD